MCMLCAINEEIIQLGETLIKLYFFFYLMLDLFSDVYEYNHISPCEQTEQTAATRIQLAKIA